MTGIFLSILAQVGADFVFQTDQMAQAKERGKWSGFAGHGLIVFILMVCLLHTYNPVTVLPFAAVIGVIHTIIDLLKRWTARWLPALAIPIFIVDQLLHLLAVFFVWQCFDWVPNVSLIGFYQHLITPQTVAVLQSSFQAPKVGISLNAVLLTFIIYIYICCGGAFFIRMLLRRITRNHPANNSVPDRTGTAIGILERMVVITLVAMNALGTVAFILTAKSIARFNELNDRRFAEYYLTGTLLSTVLAVGGGLLLMYLLPYVR